MSLICLVYVSLANQSMSDEHLKDMLKKARANNEKHDITGMLLFRDGFFMQALEGEEDLVVTLFNKIAQDSRHRDVMLVYKKPIKERSFSQWTMGFNKIDNETLDCMDGFCDFMQKPTPEFFMERASEAEALLNEFKHQIFL